MALAPLLSEDSWPDEILAVAKEFFNCEIDILAPGADGIYDPTADSFSTPAPDAVVIASRPARAQHLQLPLEQAGSYEWATRRRYRFQIELLDTDPPITKGMFIIVRGGRDPILAKMRPQVTGATNSSHAALRTIETFVEYGVVADG